MKKLVSAINRDIEALELEPRPFSVRLVGAPAFLFEYTHTGCWTLLTTDGEGVHKSGEMVEWSKDSQIEQYPHAGKYDALVGYVPEMVTLGYINKYPLENWTPQVTPGAKCPAYFNLMSTLKELLIHAAPELNGGRVYSNGPGTGVILLMQEFKDGSKTIELEHNGLRLTVLASKEDGLLFDKDTADQCRRHEELVDEMTESIRKEMVERYRSKPIFYRDFPNVIEAARKVMNHEDYKSVYGHLSGPQSAVVLENLRRFMIDSEAGRLWATLGKHRWVIEIETGIVLDQPADVMPRDLMLVRSLFNNYFTFYLKNSTNNRDGKEKLSALYAELTK